MPFPRMYLDEWSFNESHYQAIATDPIYLKKYIFNIHHPSLIFEMILIVDIICIGIVGLIKMLKEAQNLS